MKTALGVLGFIVGYLFAVALLLYASSFFVRDTNRMVRERPAAERVLH